MRAEPSWVFAFAGCLVASLELARAPLEVDAEVIEARIPGASPAPARTLDELPPRELRRLPGIGPTRALAIARARWEHGLRGAPRAWDVVPGIGAETVHAIESALTARSAASGALSPTPRTAAPGEPPVDTGTGGAGDRAAAQREAARER